MPALAQKATGDKPLYEPIVVQFQDSYMRHSASMT